MRVWDCGTHQMAPLVAIALGKPQLPFTTLEQQDIRSQLGRHYEYLFTNSDDLTAYLLWHKTRFDIRNLKLYTVEHHHNMSFSQSTHKRHSMAPREGEACSALCGIIVWGLVYEQFFHCNSNSMEYCTSHESTAVMPGAKFHSNHFTTTWMRAAWKFHRTAIRLKNRSWNRPLIYILNLSYHM